MFKIRAVLAVDDEPDLGRLLRLRAVRARRRASRAARSTSTARSTSCARATGPPPRPRAAASRPTCAGSTRSGGRTRRCSSCARCASTPSTTRTCSASPRPTPGPATPSSSSSTSPATHTQIGTTALDLPALGLDWHERFAVTDEITGATLRLGPVQLRGAGPVPGAGARLRGATVARPAACELPAAGRLTPRARTRRMPRRRPEGTHSAAMTRSRPPRRRPRGPLRAAAAGQRPGVVQARRLLRGARPRLRRQQRRRHRRPARA